MISFLSRKVWLDSAAMLCFLETEKKARPIIHAFSEVRKVNPAGKPTKKALKAQLRNS